MDFNANIIEVPDAISPIIGLRAWNLMDYSPYYAAQLLSSTESHPYPNVAGIKSVHGSFMWTDQPQSAICNKTFVCGDTPGPYCTCGFYAYKLDAERSDLLSGLFNQLQATGYVGAVGLVELWGKVLEGTKGYRAQHARIKEFCYVIRDYKHSTPAWMVEDDSGWRIARSHEDIPLFTYSAGETAATIGKVLEHIRGRWANSPASR